MIQKGQVSSFQDGQNLVDDPNQNKSSNNLVMNFSSTDDILKGLENMVQQAGGVSARTTLVAVNENEVEKSAIDKNPAILIIEPDIRPAQLIYENELDPPTTLVRDQDLPSRTLLLAEPTEPEATVLFREPEYKKSSVLYMDPEDEFSPEIKERMRRKAVTRLIEEPEEKEKPKSKLCSELKDVPELASPDKEGTQPKQKGEPQEDDDAEKDDEPEKEEKKENSGMDDFNKLFAGISLS